MSLTINVPMSPFQIIIQQLIISYIFTVYISEPDIRFAHVSNFF